MDDLIKGLAADFPQFKFEAGKTSCWSPKDSKIIYDVYASNSEIWAVFHELGHATLGHKSYSSDFELLQLEVSAWEKAGRLAQKYGQTIDTEHIQNCLDTYREWLHRRSTCPVCGNHSLQLNSTKYSCFNCHSTWKVTASRFCRPYRQTVDSTNKKSPRLKSQATFQ